MRIGISSYWFNRGQAVVARQLRSAIDQLGHETFVLARPTRAGNIRPSFIDHSDVWDQPGVTEASSYEIPAAELEGWAREHELDVAFFDQSYQFEAIGRLRELGVRTVGRFVWEHFSPEHVEPARRALETVYSMTACEQERYGRLGLDTPRVHWGCHPELLEAAARFDADPPRSAEGTVVYFFPGGFMTKRKPLGPTVDAFRRARDERLRLVVKAQVDRRAAGRRWWRARKRARGSARVRHALRRDRRIELIAEDLPSAEHLRLFASADVCLAPSRWEGLGLHLYEATALGLPLITNDNPPMNEVVRDSENGLLVRGVPSAERPRSGIPSFDPDPEELGRAIERLADPQLRDELAAGARRARERLSWTRTVESVRNLLEG